MEQIGALTERIRDYDRQLETISKERYPETELLRQVEGVGALTALTFVLTLEDPYRFERSRSVGAFVPARDQKGILASLGHIFEGVYVLDDDAPILELDRPALLELAEGPGYRNPLATYHRA